MIRGLHGRFYSTEAEAMRAFIKDKLQLKFTDVGLVTRFMRRRRRRSPPGRRSTDGFLRGHRAQLR